MRLFNKIFIIALPRCATVSLCDALGLLGIPTAHLGRIYGEASGEHHHPQRLTRIYQQIGNGDYDLDILKHCRGLADYPACCATVYPQLDRQFPGSLFINVRRDGDLPSWLQSVERQFVGLQLIKQSRGATPAERQFMQVMLSLRKMTFGQSEFDPDVYRRAYHVYQRQVEQTFSARPGDLLQFEDVAELETVGFKRLCDFLDCTALEQPFPNCNTHSLRPQNAFMQALAEGQIQSLTGITVENR
jgi:hypothetical protein